MRVLARLAATALSGILVGCGSGGDSTPDASQPPGSVDATVDITFSGADEGVTPFIYTVHLAGQRIAAITSISYEIEAKPGTVSRPVHVSYSLQALKNRGYLASDRRLDLPVFGLYADYRNTVSIAASFQDGSSQLLAVSVTTPAYADPNAIYDRPTILVAREPGDQLGFDFFAMKSNLGSPVIIDTDGNLRWVASPAVTAMSSAFTDNLFIVGDPAAPTIYRLELDGQVATVPLSTTKYRYFHHNIDPGKSGLLGEVDTASDFESTIVEFDATGSVQKEWDFAAILSSYMAANGDDPTGFVRPGIDWFHSNAATFDARDDTLITSSRENFLVKVDYQTGDIKWVFGDPTKYWARFPSLRAKSLALTGSGLYPIGQHATSITSDGLLMVFNDGYESLQAPAGAPVGEHRNYSAVSAYRIDEDNRTATEAWRFDYDQSISSLVCSSAYEAAGRSLLVDYAWADMGNHARIVGLDVNHHVALDFQYDNHGACNTGWNAVPIPLDQLSYP